MAMLRALADPALAMQLPVALGGCAVLALALAVAPFPHPQDPPPPPATPAMQPAPPPAHGHYAFVVTGDATRLAVTHAVAKTDAWGGVPKGLASEFTLAIVDARGIELARVPLDLRSFDTDPANAGKPLVVKGCEVRDSRIALLVNVPRFAAAARYVLRRGDLVLGAIEGDAVRRLAGETR